MSAVGLFISEGVICFVYGGNGYRIGRLETAQIELLFEVIVRDVAIALGEVGFEKHNIDFIGLGLRHAVYDPAIRTLLATGGIKRFLRRASAIHLDLADNEIAYYFNAFPKRSKHHHSEILDTENLLSDVRANLGPVFTHSVADFVDDVFDLAVGYCFKCGHDLCHGVILSFLISLYAEEALYYRCGHSQKVLILRHFLAMTNASHIKELDLYQYSMPSVKSQWVYIYNVGNIDGSFIGIFLTIASTPFGRISSVSVTTAFVIVSLETSPFLIGDFFGKAFSFLPSIIF